MFKLRENKEGSKKTDIFILYTNIITNVLKILYILSGLVCDNSET